MIGFLKRFFGGTKVPSKPENNPAAPQTAQTSNTAEPKIGGKDAVQARRMLIDDGLLPPELLERSKQEVAQIAAERGKQEPSAPDRTDANIADTAAQKSHTATSLLDRNYRFIAVDVETANANQHSICQIGLAMIESDGTIHTVSHLINPEEFFDDFNVNLHGIDEPDVEGEPHFPAFMEVSRALLERHLLIQHSNFDSRAFDLACHRYGLPKLNTTWTDSVQIARRAWPGLKGNGGHGLANLKDHLGLEFDHHDAGEDAYAAAMVVLMAETKLGKAFTDILTVTPPTRKNYPQKITRTGAADGAFAGMSICFTGKTETPRAELANIAAEAGMDVKSSVSKKISILVVAEDDALLDDPDDMSTKQRKATELIEAGHEIRIMDEYEFIDMIESGDDLSIDVGKIIEREIARAMKEE